jgi:hypothetical protein
LYLEIAFDSVNHNILLAKLKFYGINGRVYAFYELYLENIKEWQYIMRKRHVMKSQVWPSIAVTCVT